MVDTNLLTMALFYFQNFLHIIQYVTIVDRGRSENGGINCLLECVTKEGKTVAIWGEKGGIKPDLKNIHQIGGKKAPIKIQADKHYENRPDYYYWIPQSANLKILS